MGYRGPEKEPKKDRGTFRVVAYGSYMTFGEGVQESETYLSRAEEMLNSKLKKQRVEFLNAGMESATFILGLARLSREFESTDADAVIFEYGFIDAYMPPEDLIADGYNTLIGQAEREPMAGKSFFSRMMRSLEVRLKFFESYLYNSCVYTALKSKLLVTDNVEFVGYADLKEALTATSKKLIAAGKKVFIVVNPSVTKVCEKQLKQAAEESGAVLVNVKGAFRDNLPTEKMLADFDSDPGNFIREMGFERKNIDWWRGADLKIYAPYFQNLFQLSPLGHELAGKTLADSIEAGLIRTRL
jgi:hypothetical protein